LLPVWCGFPLGLVDDCFNGLPFGSGIVLWSAALIVSDILEARFPWRNFITDWLVASLYLLAYCGLSLALTNRAGGAAGFALIVPQMVAAVVAYPMVGRLVGWVDRWRLTRFRVIG
jgi:rod shape-determining protein MreD